MEGRSATPFGVYVHIPFCRRRCDYCAFATWTDRHHLHSAYVDACRRELTGADLPAATSVFVGGGTPSALGPSLLAALLREIRRTPTAEVTVECNPDDATTSRLAAWVAAGATRVSFGVQSMVPHVLRSLGRSHDPDAVAKAVAAARAVGFATFNLDLIYGAVGETHDDWRTTLEAVVDLEPPHVSAYALTVEPGTPLARDRARHPDDDDQAEKYAMADGLLRAAGLDWYEISNWAAPGHECAHNQLYWDQHPYRGIGCAAHSYDGARRWWNVRTPDRYIALVAAGRSPEAGSERLSATARLAEAAQLALRTRGGVPWAAVPDDGTLDGLVEPSEDGRHAVLTVAGRLLANEVSLRLR